MTALPDRPTIETEADAWHQLTDPGYDWPERVIAVLHAEIERTRDA